MDQRGQQGGGGSPWLVLPPHQQLDWSLAAARNAVLAFLQDSWHASMGARGGGRWCGGPGTPPPGASRCRVLGQFLKGDFFYLENEGEGPPLRKLG